MRGNARGCILAIGVFGISTVSAAQGMVAGRVTIQERSGETTTDLANTVIYLTPKNGTPRFAETKTQMAMNGRQFAPRVRVVTTGSTIEYPNQDPFSHNIFSSAPGALFDLGVYGSGVAKSAQFRKAGAFPVYCNIHAKMTGYVVAVSTPYYITAGVDGRWTMPKIPAGKYELHIWHERTPEVVRELDVPAFGLDAVDQKLDATGFKAGTHKNKFGQDYTSGGARY